MSSRDRGAPAFVKQALIKTFEKHLPAFLVQVQASYKEEHGYDIPLEMPEISGGRPLRIARWPFMVIGPEENRLDEGLTETVVGRIEGNREPGRAVFQNTLRAELGCINNKTAEVKGVPDSKLTSTEVVAIQAANILWALYYLLTDYDFPSQLLAEYAGPPAPQQTQVNIAPQIIRLIPGPIDQEKETLTEFGELVFSLSIG